ncbi:pregnancy-specific beta-1-glycoprotein 5-like [Dendropsophus ebraccatus]|uniref:pregnancy-specific beta-1-glycoprotein 5-like n=1 Tax=Dendropsophus ebraccatus TaxID=150705 RepID=UPI0038316741
MTGATHINRWRYGKYYHQSQENGPDEAHIEGPLSVRSGSPITLSCSAESSPPPEYRWKHNGNVLEEKTNTYNVSNVRTEDQGLYTCVVRNPVTLHNVTATVHVTVTAEPIIDRTRLSLGLILGLAFATIFGVVGLVIGSVCAYKKCATKKVNESSKTKEEDSTDYANMKAQYVKMP